MAQDRQPEEAANGEKGVFGNLPSGRPGVRSPRRGVGRDKAASSGARAAGQQPASEQEPKPPPARPTSPPPPRAEPVEPEPGAAQSGGVEDLAWAGITVAAEAATLGVRLLGRAVEAVRKPSDQP